MRNLKQIQIPTLPLLLVGSVLFILLLPLFLILAVLGVIYALITRRRLIKTLNENINKYRQHQKTQHDNQNQKGRTVDQDE